MDYAQVAKLARASGFSKKAEQHRGARFERLASNQLPGQHHLADTRNPAATKNRIAVIRQAGFTKFHNYCIRALLYPDQPNWRLLHNSFP